MTSHDRSTRKSVDADIKPNVQEQEFVPDDASGLGSFYALHHTVKELGKGTLAPQTVIRLQSTVGNRVTQQLLNQTTNNTHTGHITTQEAFPWLLSERTRVAAEPQIQRGVTEEDDSPYGDDALSEGDSSSEDDGDWSDEVNDIVDEGEFNAEGDADSIEDEDEQENDYERKLHKIDSEIKRLRAAQRTITTIHQFGPMLPLTLIDLLSGLGMNYDKKIGGKKTKWKKYLKIVTGRAGLGLLTSGVNIHNPKVGKKNPASFGPKLKLPGHKLKIFALRNLPINAIQWASRLITLRIKHLQKKRKRLLIAAG